VRSTARLGLLALAALGALPGCSALEPAPGHRLSADRWNALVARRGVTPAEAPNPMDATPAMMVAAKELGGVGGADELRLNRLHTALLDGRAFTFEYEKSSTFSAADAFANRRGNCVSFTNLFIALGRSLGIRLQAALVSARGVSERAGDLIVTYNHMVAVYSIAPGKTKLYDFYRTGEKPGERVSLLDDLSVAAIRASNDGVAHLARGEPAEAEHDLEIAVKLGPRLGSLYANLGLAKWRNGDVAGAFAALRKGLEAEPHSPPLLQNLSALYLDQQRPAEARAALAALDVQHAYPYIFIVRGDLEMRGGNVKGALRNYREAAGLDSKLAEPWIGIGRAELSRGRADAARKAAKKALKRDPKSADAQRLLDEIR